MGKTENINIFKENETIFFSQSYKFYDNQLSISNLLKKTKTELIEEVELTNPSSCKKQCIIDVVNEKATDVIFRQTNTNKICVLNFASATTPGGGYINGASAQEEDLCRSSFLYQSLLQKPEFYHNNKQCKHKIYLDNAIYSSDVVFHRDSYGFLTKPILSDVITIPAPNIKNNKIDIQILNPILSNRINKILQLAKSKKVETLILGAWGCGVFGNDPKLISKLFSETIKNEYSCAFKNIIFAIFDNSENKENYNSFLSEFSV